jgi:hypothetical protein
MRKSSTSTAAVASCNRRQHLTYFSQSRHMEIRSNVAAMHHECTSLFCSVYADVQSLHGAPPALAELLKSIYKFRLSTFLNSNHLLRKNIKSRFGSTSKFARSISPLLQSITSRYLPSISTINSAWPVAAAPPCSPALPTTTNRSNCLCGKKRA